TISGLGFQGGATVTIGGVGATVLALSTGEIVVRTPAHALGAADVTVTNPDGQSSTLVGAFTYVPVPSARPGQAAPVTPNVNPAPRAAQPAPAGSAPQPAPLPVGR